MQEEIFFYFTSDLHSYFDNWPKIVHFLNQRVIERKNKNQSYYILDNGDHIDRMNPITEALKGKGNVELLNEAHYHVVTLGNNEGITLTKKELYQLYDQAEFSVVCANLFSRIDPNPSWLKPYEILITNSGVRIAVIGLTAPFTAFYNPLAWDIDDPFVTLSKYIKEIEENSDIILLLSHLGIDQDEMIAEQFPEIDVIIGGHTHHLFEIEEHRNQSILTAVGKSGFYVGEIQLSWDHDTQSLVGKKAAAHPVPDGLEDSKTTELLNKQRLTTKRIMNKEVVTLTRPLEVDWFKETYLIKQLVHTLKNWTNADAAMLNAGILLGGFDQGIVTELDVHKNCPHPINPCLVVITGQELLEIVRAGLTKAYQQNHVKGYGFRGKVMGTLVYADIDFELEHDDEGKAYVESLWIGNEPLNVKKKYRLATADMFTFGHLSPQISRAQSKKFFMPEFMRDLLKVTLKEIAEKS
ncbi:bifunctional metallophosphatase/5'-nucleotidase [Amphibacillus sp. MSJ-3]|uniref:bifunctional metallophosphatase/5'-nucleotidase n=1 Tax=Amphibacillus sp. MSJ-3 TaxID=2841505 RepID=UPI001C0E95FF|nr:bifunctional UDP-sugar hydrolase/5'-nucleotidase [Amphibacillus sp. MSJ-3]MBU5595625.1 bifunctional metallophosphatase/5'-nucleotidase [Amphibacillus sp. MSJ-3]